MAINDRNSFSAFRSLGRRSTPAPRPFGRTRAPSALPNLDGQGPVIEGPGFQPFNDLPVTEGPGFQPVGDRPVPEGPGFQPVGEQPVTEGPGFQPKPPQFADNAPGSQSQGIPTGTGFGVAGSADSPPLRGGNFASSYALGGPVEDGGDMTGILATINDIMLYGQQKNGLGQKTADFGKRKPQQGLPVKEITPPGTIKGPDVDWQNPGGPQNVPPIQKTSEMLGGPRTPTRGQQPTGAMREVMPEGVDPEAADTGYPTIVSPRTLPSWQEDPKYQGNRELITAGIPDDETQNLAEGGPVEDELEPSADSWMQPPAQSEIPGELPAPPTDQAPGELEQAGVLPHQAVQKGGAMILRWLQGADAVPTPVVQRLEQEVDPDHTMPEDARKLKTVQAALERGGKDTALGVVQNYRQQYDLQRNFAAVKLNAGDIAAAAEAATRASPNMPDGTVLQFAPEGDGVTVAVSKVAPIQGEQPQRIHLTAAQFNEYLRDNAGQYDHLFATGSLKTLQKLATSQGKPVDKPTVAAPAAGPSELPAGATPVQGAAPQNFQQTKAELEARADRMFGKGLVVNPAREEWLQTEERKLFEAETGRIKANSPMGVADRRGQTAERVAETRAQTWRDRNGTMVEINKAKMATALQVAASRAASEQQKAAMATVRAEIMAGPDMMLTPDQLQISAKRHGVDPSSLAHIYGVLGVAPQAAPVAPAPRAPAAGPPVPQAPAAAPTRDPRYYYDAQGNKIGRKQ